MQGSSRKGCYLFSLICRPGVRAEEGGLSALSPGKWGAGLNPKGREGGRRPALGQLHIPAPLLQAPLGGRGLFYFLPSFLQREEWLFQVQAMRVVRSRKETRGSRMASTSIVPAGQQTGWG